jgi:hypothetical protein
VAGAAPAMEIAGEEAAGTRTAKGDTDEEDEEEVVYRGDYRRKASKYYWGLPVEARGGAPESVASPDSLGSGSASPDGEDSDSES